MYVSGHQLLSFLKSGIWLSASLTLTGCLADYGDTSSRGIPLSKAMESSASGSHEPLQGREPETPVDTGVLVAGAASGSGGSGDSPVSYSSRDYSWQVPMDVGFAVPLNGQIRSLTRFSLTPVSVEDDYNYLGVFVAGDVVDLQPGSLPDQAVKNIWMFEVGPEYRRYFTPAHTFISPYLCASVAYQVMYWDYRNPVIVNGDEIKSDALEGVGGYAGFGVAFHRNSHLSLFGEAGFGGTVFLPETTQGFDNDVFSDFGYFMVKAGLCVKF